MHKIICPLFDLYRRRNPKDVVEKKKYQKEKEKKTEERVKAKLKAPHITFHDPTHSSCLLLQCLMSLPSPAPPPSSVYLFSLSLAVFPQHTPF